MLYAQYSCRITLLEAPGHLPKTIYTWRKACHSMCNVYPKTLEKIIEAMVMEASGQYEWKPFFRETGLIMPLKASAVASIF